MGDPDSARALRPLRRPTLPGGPTLLRAGLVAALLGLAATVLHTPTGCPPATAGPTGAAPTSGPAAAPAAGPTRAAATSGSAADGSPITHGRPDDGEAGPTAAGATAGPPSTTTGSGTAGPLPLPSGAVGVPVRLAEPAALAVVRPGARVDLLAAAPGGASTEAALLAPAALVLDVLGADTTDGSSALYLALRPDQAKRTVGLPEGTRFAIVVRD
ncbi:flagellar biosynthesis protein FlgA [Micromonospora sp. NPDC049175]|uniref:flagellar biosynthesis protein FlgA n=1 Tax=Micromonospora sp. NPDC049175 TaxID=3364266 RepID=UPI003720E3E8